MKAKKVVGRRQETAEKTIAVDIAQDLAALRNRKGDTGRPLSMFPDGTRLEPPLSFLRKRHLAVKVNTSSAHHRPSHISNAMPSSLFLAKQILQLYHFPKASSTSFLTAEKASSSRVLELGAGTGVLGILLHQLFASWTASDQYDNLKLISRNVKHNGEPKNLQVEEVDWVDIHKEKMKADKKYNGSEDAGRRKGSAEEYDLIVAVDCIYNEALIPPFVSALEHYATKGKTIVMVVCELRSADVVSVGEIHCHTLRMTQR